MNNDVHSKICYIYEQEFKWGHLCFSFMDFFCLTNMFFFSHLLVSTFLISFFEFILGYFRMWNENESQTYKNDTCDEIVNRQYAKYLSVKDFRSGRGSQ